MKIFTTVRKFSATVISLSMIAMPIGTLVTPLVATAAVNLISNGTLDAHTAVAAPTGWVPAGFDSAGPITNKATFSYVAGRNSTSSDSTDMAVKIVVINAISGGGDAKWAATSVSPVTPSGFYTFSDWYKSNVTSYLIAEYTHTNGTIDFHSLATLDQTAGAWVKTSQDFDIPSDVTSIRVFHFVREIGELTTDDYVLSAGAPTSDSFSFPIITLTFDDGWDSQYFNALPQLRSKQFPATFYIISTTTVAASSDLIEKQSVEFGGTLMTSNSHGATWSPIFRDHTITKYQFSDTSVGAASTIVVTYTALGGSATSSIATSVPATVIPTSTVFNFTLPATTASTSISIAHTSAGTLSVTSGSGVLLGNALGYMNKVQLKNLLADPLNFEVGEHTQNHCSLSRLIQAVPAACAFPQQPGTSPQGEVSGAKNILESMLGTTITTLAYPYGEYNSEVKGLATTAGITSARTVDTGYNRKTSDRLALKTQSVDNTTTLSQLQGWINNAINNNLWLILTFHQVDNPALNASNGETGGVTTANFNAFMDELQSHSSVVHFLTIKDAIQYMDGASPRPVSDTTAPVIAAHTDVNAQATSSQGTVVNYTAPSFTDNTAPLTGTSTCNPLSGTLFTVGTSTVTCSASDTAGNRAVATTFKVIVAAPVATSTGGTGTTTPPTADTTKPVLTLLGSSTMARTVGEGFTEVGATASDNVDGNITSRVVITGGVDSSRAGTYTVRYNVTDAAGNAATEVTRSVIYSAASTGSTAPAPVASGGGGGGGNGPIVGSIGFINFGFGPDRGIVLGTTTVNVPGVACVDLLTSNLFYKGKSNKKAHVKLLQLFLNRHGENLPVTGLYGSYTKASVNRFQVLHSSEILAPLGFKKPTGHTGVMTRKVINQLYCTEK